MAIGPLDQFHESKTTVLEQIDKKEWIFISSDDDGLVFVITQLIFRIRSDPICGVSLISTEAGL